MTDDMSIWLLLKSWGKNQRQANVATQQSFTPAQPRYCSSTMIKKVVWDMMPCSLNLYEEHNPSSSDNSRRMLKS
jgi:hypothetical protein